LISVLILTKNEERDLPDCLQSVCWSDDVHVFDSGSTDRTVDLAQSLGAKVWVRSYQTSTAFGGDEASHRNWGLRNIPFKYAWVLCVDADERTTAQMIADAKAVVSRAGPEVAFRVERRDFFLGTWLKHVQATAFYIRLFRPEKMRYERLINPVLIPDGPVGEIGGYLDHYPFSKGIDHWLNRHNDYSRLEAHQIIKNRAACTKLDLRKAFFSTEFHVRRHHQKELFYRAPLRPLLKFLLLYGGKRGFLDGSAGFTYAALQAIYEYFIILKVRELERASSRAVE
jgi:glycosyltransferase involved in cell wall biosynthesis